VQQGFTLLIEDTDIQATSMQIDSTIMTMSAIVKVHWVFSFLVWLPSRLVNRAKLGKRLNEYQGARSDASFVCAAQLKR